MDGKASIDSISYFDGGRETLPLKWDVTLPNTVTGTVFPVLRDPFRLVRELIPVVCEVIRGQNSTIWGFREAENACFLKAGRGF